MCRRSIVQAVSKRVLAPCAAHPISTTPPRRMPWLCSQPITASTSSRRTRPKADSAPGDRMVRVLEAPARKNQSINRRQNDAPAQHLNESRGQPGATVNNRTDTNPPAEFNRAFHHRMTSGEIILMEVRIMSDGLIEAAIAGVTFAAAAAIWLLAGYLIQRFVFRNPQPTAGTVLATSMGTSMLLFSLGSLLAFHIR
jgi:hypothetical protein